jgi:hypothetical protein
MTLFVPPKREREKRKTGRTIIMFTTDSYVDAKIMFALHGMDMGMACKGTLSLKNSVSIHLSCRI